MIASVVGSSATDGDMAFSILVARCAWKLIEVYLKSLSVQQSGMPVERPGHTGQTGFPSRES